MILPTIVAYLKANATITDVRLRDNNVINPGSGKAYYLVVWEENIPSALSADNGLTGIRIECHAPVGDSDIIDAFILFEIRTLLDRVTLTDTNSSAIHYQTSVTREITSINSLNEDKTISRSRLITLPERWR